MTRLSKFLLTPLIIKLKKPFMNTKVSDVETQNVYGKDGIDCDEVSSASKYDSLTSKLKDDNSTSPYFNALDFAFSQTDVKNIAITGPYGAGKSTVIESFLSLHKKIPTVNVSLAGFDITGIENKPDSREVELSILQQILYKVDRDTVPDSRIDRIKDRNDKHVHRLFLSLVKIAIPFLTLMALIFTDTSGQFFLLPTNLENLLKEHYIIRATTIIILFLIALYYFTQSASKAGIFDKKLKLSKIAFLSGNTELQEQESSASLLNACLDEIVYFFSRSKYRTVVFEDLDRLGKSDIFVKLREINKIINNNRNQNDPVRFIYAVKDDIFLGADVRTKFFDFIVPIVPIMDNRNAYSILKSKIIQFPEADFQCLRGASLYITDMRSLQNIINEYNLFMDIVDNQSSKPKLFALIFYKNLFALDYNLVDKKLGILYSYMHDFRTRTLHAKHFANLDSQLVELETKLKKAKLEQKSTSVDVREEILSRFIPKNLRTVIFFCVNEGNSYSWSIKNADDLVNDENDFINYFSLNKVIYICINNYQSRYDLEPSEIPNSLKEYKIREKLTQNSRMEVIKQLQEAISEVKSNIRKRNEISLADLTKLNGQEVFNTLTSDYIKAINDVNILSKEQEKTVLDSLQYGGFDALYYLIINSYLMQDFMMYRSIFYKGSISAEDNEYIKKVGIYINHTEANDSCTIENVADVTRELIENSYILRDGALHHQVFAYLLHHNSIVLKDVINSLFNKGYEDIASVLVILSERFENQDDFNYFIIAATDSSDHQDKLLKVIQETDNHLVHTRIIISMMVHVDLSKSQKHDDFKKHIEQLGWGLISELELSQVDSYMTNAKSLGVNYRNIEVRNEVEQISAEFIADNNMYTLDRADFCKIVSAKINKKDISSEDVANSPWSLIMDNNLSIIEDYIVSDINTFIKEIFLLSNEDNSSVLTMLNNDNIEVSIKTQIISDMNFTLENHTKVSKNLTTDIDKTTLTLYDLLFQYDRIKLNWLNLTSYVNIECDRDVLRNYLNRHSTILSDKKSQPPSETSNDIYRKIICDDQLSDDAYQQVTEQLNITYELLDSNIPISNLRRLVDNNRLPLSKESYDHIFYSHADSSEIIDFLLFWFFRYEEEFTSKLEFYMRKNEDINFFKKLLIESLILNEFSNELMANLIVKFISFKELHLIKSIYIDFDIIKLAIIFSSSEQFKIGLINQYVCNSQSTKDELLEYTSHLKESELEVRKIFTQRRQATLNTSMTESIQELLTTLKNKKYITEFTDIGNGKIFVKIESDLKTTIW